METRAADQKRVKSLWRKTLHWDVAAGMEVESVFLGIGMIARVAMEVPLDAGFAMLG